MNLRGKLSWSIALAAALVLIALVMLRPPGPPEGVAHEDVSVPDPGDKPLTARIWHPSDLGSGKHALVVISHGTGGNMTGHSDTAEALAQAGYVVVAVNHTGDNSGDTSYIAKGKQLIGRPRHINRAIDFMLDIWRHRRSIDAQRIGMFGHSAGGFTGLVVLGGIPDMTRGPERCRKYPDKWDCRYLKKQGMDISKSVAPPDDAWVHDSRVRSAAIAAPAIGYAFEPDRLSAIHAPLQLWEAEHDAIVEDSPAIIRRLLPTDLPVDHRIVPGAGHFSFLMPCNSGMRIVISAMRLVSSIEAVCDDPDGFDRSAIHKRFNRDLIKFFEKTLAAQSS